MKVFYCDGWFRAKKCAPCRWDEATAMAAHSQRQPYTVLIDSSTAPNCFIEVTNDSIGIGFLDGLLREYLSYEFQEERPRELFLSRVVLREFRERTDMVTKGTSYFFHRDGRVVIHRQDFVSDTLERAETRADVSGNWEPYPEFGDYASLTRIERHGTFPIARGD